MISSMEARFCKEMNVISADLDEPFIRVFVFVFGTHRPVATRVSERIEKRDSRDVEKWKSLERIKFHRTNSDF